MYTEPISGISIKSNGSQVAESFLVSFEKTVKDSEALKQSQKEIIYEKYGTVYFVNPDGWAEKCKQKGFDSYEGVLDYYRNTVPHIGELLCVGWLGDKYNQNFVIYKITKVEMRNRFFDLSPMVYGEEVEEFSTKERI